MRTHEDIIAAAGGFRELAKKINQAENTVRFWERRKSIPVAYWPMVAGAEIATLEELLAPKTADTQPPAKPLSTLVGE